MDFSVVQGGYDHAPYVLDLHGSRHQIGWDYAALTSEQTSYTLTAFMSAVFPSAEDKFLFSTFLDFLWDELLMENTPQYFLDEIKGMRDYQEAHSDNGIEYPAHLVATRFYTVANLPADSQNIIAMLEQEFEQGLPTWLKNDINKIIKLLERLIHSCDAYGVWGSRTIGGLLYSSRNLDYASNTGINKYKLVIFYDITEDSGRKLPGYASIGFTDGLGALAGISQIGITVSEMNLDNSRVTFSGPPFPLRLRMVLEQGKDLESAMSVWNGTHNTNSFNFLIGSAPDALKGNNGAYALETIMGFTAQFPADSPIEAAATYNCSGANAADCRKWTNETGIVHIGRPLPEAVWRTNHGLSPVVLKTQEPLFNNTVFRYNLMNKLFNELQAAKQQIDDEIAVDIVATLGIKGVNYFTCAQDLQGDNVMSIAYAPGPRGKESPLGHMYIAWEAGSGSEWRPAACAPYIRVDLSHWIK
eukprot:TRINITY_DN11432_c0_g1_i1.p1 TRINITY_DN11432_c0_g1~~TRINITY_DN11432_c0_g1_i1.p1  ORF type:complete len:519 (+),score=87.78 TRINITY_DN11432_c0_g1_i1:144-1559(+)